MAAIMKTAARNTAVLQTLKLHIGMGLEGERSEDNSIDLQVQIAEIDAEFQKNARPGIHRNSGSL